MYNTLPTSVTVYLAHLKEKGKKKQSALLLGYRAVWETRRNKTGKRMHMHAYMAYISI